MDDDGWMCFERSPQNESQIHSPLGFGCHVWMSLVSHHPIQTSIAHYSLPGSTNKPRSLNGFMDAADGHWPFTFVRFFTATPVPEWVKEFQTRYLQRPSIISKNRALSEECFKRHPPTHPPLKDPLRL